MNSVLKVVMMNIQMMRNLSSISLTFDKYYCYHVICSDETDSQTDIEESLKDIR